MISYCLAGFSNQIELKRASLSHVLMVNNDLNNWNEQTDQEDQDDDYIIDVTHTYCKKLYNILSIVH